MTFPTTPGHNQGTPTPGASPDGYMLGPDENQIRAIDQAPPPATGETWRALTTRNARTLFSMM